MDNKYRRVYAEIDLDMIKHNVNAMRAHINDGVKYMTVIKADGYGHGAIPIGKEVEALNVDYIGIAIFQEGVLLRNEGIKTPILVLGNTPREAFNMLFEYNLTQTVYSVKMARELNEAAKSYGKTANIHVKLDTGMGRIGIRAIHEPLDNVIEQVKEIREMSHLYIEGMYTHLSKADETDKTYTMLQINTFKNVINGLEKLDIKPSIIHASNSAGLIDVKEAGFNMVRAGIALYGLYPSEEVDHSVDLRPVLSWVSRVVNIKEVEAGELISYGGTYETTDKTTIATIPIGYADGYSRLLSNKGNVVINGQLAPIIGRVCMDQFMVDVTHINDVTEDDKVYLIGGTGDASVSTDDIANIMKTINYEVVCLISKRVPRVYMKENEVIDTIDYF